MNNAVVVATHNERSDPSGWLQDVVPAGSDEPVRVVFVRRDDQKVYVRQVDPCEPDPPRIPLFDGDQVVLMVALSYASINTSPDVGNVAGLVLALRIVETRREGGIVYARTLRHGEEDTGARVHVEPGERVALETVTVELDHIDSLEEPTSSGHVPLTPVLAAWLSIGAHDPARIRYLLAAARRLDETNRHLIEVAKQRVALEAEDLAGPDIRRYLYRLIGAVESAMIALGRTIDMAVRANTLILSPPTPAPLPAAVSSSKKAVLAIRNAYEHIEDRALGLDRGSPSPDALTIFDYTRLLDDNVVVYGPHRLDLTHEVPQLLASVRDYFKSIAATDPWD